MCDTMALPISTPKWRRHIRRLLTTTSLLAGALVLTWSIVEMADEGGVVAHIGGVEINATIDEEMMLNLRISAVGTVASPVGASDPATGTTARGEEDYVFYDDEGEDDQMVDTPFNYQIAQRGKPGLSRQVASQ